MPSKDERNAAFDAAKSKIIEMVKEFVPWPYEDSAEKWAEDKKNTGKILSVVDAALAAAEKVRTNG